MGKIKKAISLFLYLIIVINIFIISISFLTKIAILNPYYYFSNFKQKQVYSNVKENILNDLGDIAKQNKIEKELFLKYIDDRFVEANINRMVYASIDYFIKVENSMPLPNLSLKVVVKRDLQDYYTSKGISITEDIDKKLEAISNDVNDIVEKDLMIVKLKELEKFQTIRDFLNYFYRNQRMYIYIFIIFEFMLFLLVKLKRFLKLNIVILGVEGTVIAIFSYISSLFFYNIKIPLSGEGYNLIVLDIIKSCLYFWQHGC